MLANEAKTPSSIKTIARHTKLEAKQGPTAMGDETWPVVRGQAEGTLEEHHLRPVTGNQKDDERYALYLDSVLTQNPVSWYYTKIGVCKNRETLNKPKMKLKHRCATSAL